MARKSKRTDDEIVARVLAGSKKGAQKVKEIFAKHRNRREDQS